MRKRMSRLLESVNSVTSDSCRTHDQLVRVIAVRSTAIDNHAWRMLQPNGVLLRVTLRRIIGLRIRKIHN